MAVRWEQTPGGSTRAWRAVAAPRPVVDAHGCGDSFAAGVTFALGEGRPLPEVIELGARCGAGCVTGRGPYGAHL